MKKSIYFALILFTISIIAVSCNHIKPNSKSKGMEQNEGMEQNDGSADLWARINDADYKATWNLWPGKGEFYKGTHPHGALLTTYLNDVAYTAISNAEKNLPYGSIIIKENYMPDKMLGAITVMERIEGFNPEADDWYWVKYKGTGEVFTMEKDGMSMKLAGKVPGCIGCHTASLGGIKYIMTK